jgi:hypothetical protein
VSTGPRRKAWSPVPWAAMKALGRGEILHSDYAILGWLFGRENHDTHRVSAQLSWIVEGIGWSKTEDALYRRIVGLRDAGWLGYTTTPGQHEAVYSFELFPEHDPTDHEASDEGPRRTRRPRPSMAATEPRSGSELAAGVDQHGSEETTREETVEDPRRASPGPRSVDDENGSPEPNRASSREAHLRGSQNVRGEQNLLPEERLEEEVLGSSTEDQLLGEGTPRKSGVKESLLTRIPKSVQESTLKQLQEGEVVREPPADETDQPARGNETGAADDLMAP